MIRWSCAKWLQLIIQILSPKHRSLTLVSTPLNPYRFLFHNHEWLLQPRLKEAEEARTLCIAIEGLECAGELVQALTAHSSEMTALYRELHTNTTANVDTMEVYEPLFQRAATFTQWFRSRKKVANTMKSAAAAASKWWALVQPKLMLLGVNI